MLTPPQLISYLPKDRARYFRRGIKFRVTELEDDIWRQPEPFNAAGRLRTLTDIHRVADKTLHYKWLIIATNWITLDD